MYILNPYHLCLGKLENNVRITLHFCEMWRRSFICQPRKYIYTAVFYYFKSTRIEDIIENKFGTLKTNPIFEPANFNLSTRKFGRGARKFVSGRTTKIIVNLRTPHPNFRA